MNPHMREAEIITNLEINNIDGWSILSLKLFTLSRVDSQHLPVFAAAVNFKVSHSSVWGSLCFTENTSKCKDYSYAS